MSEMRVQAWLCSGEAFSSGQMSTLYSGMPWKRTDRQLSLDIYKGPNPSQAITPKNPASQCHHIGN